MSTKGMCTKGMARSSRRKLGGTRAERRQGHGEIQLLRRRPALRWCPAIQDDKQALPCGHLAHIARRPAQTARELFDELDHRDCVPLLLDGGDRRGDLQQHCVTWSGARG